MYIKFEHSNKSLTSIHPLVELLIIEALHAVGYLIIINAPVSLSNVLILLLIVFVIVFCESIWLDFIASFTCFVLFLLVLLLISWAQKLDP